MSLPEFLLAGFASWLVLAAVGGSAWAFGVTRLKRLARRRAEVINVQDWLPPVPRSEHRETDAMWLDAWPTDVEPGDIDELEQRVYDRLFDDLIAIEGLQ